MRTNIVIDDALMRNAMRASGLGTKRAVVEAGLRLLVQVRAQFCLLNGHALLHNDRDYDHFEHVLGLQVVHP